MEHARRRGPRRALPVGLVLARGDFLDLVSSTIDLVFANEDEARALFRAGDSTRSTSSACSPRSRVGPWAFLVVTPAGTVEVPALDVAEVVDTNGAGDLFAALLVRAGARR